MLTKRHLAIIHASLQFFDEEMSPFGPDMARPYFEESLEEEEEELAIGEVRQLRQLLQTVELRYLCCDETEATVLDQELLKFEQAQNTLDLLDGRIATVLLTSRP